MLRLVEAFDDHDDVQKVYANFDIPNEEMATIQWGHTPAPSAPGCSRPVPAADAAVHNQ